MVATPSITAPLRRTAAPRRLLAALVSAATVVSTALVATPAHAGTPRSIFTSADAPVTAAIASGRTANIGVKFSASTAGVITAVRIYRGPRQTRTFTASVWSSKSKRLAKVSVAASGAVGWQTASLAKPVSVKKGSSYYVSYLAVGGHSPITTSAFAHPYTHDGITVPKSGGRITYAKTSVRPKKATKTNYFVDVVFVPNSSGVTAAELQTAATRRVFFGHQSVGWNILDGVNQLYQGAGRSAAPQVQLSAPSEAITPASGGVLAHAEVGDNGNPDGKVDAFAAYLRGGVAAKVKVAVVKYCFVDLYDGSDAQARFTHYRTVMAGLEAEFPQVHFLYATNPLTTDSPADNAVRTQFNALIRNQYAGTGRLWDIAAIESTRPDGSRLRGSYGGHSYEALYEGYSSDGGHLNAAGSKAVAAELLKLIAQLP